MAQRQTNMQIVLSGKIDNTLGQIGEALVNIGFHVDDLSRKLIDFGKGSLNVYKDYELSMHEAKEALKPNVNDEEELKRQMKMLDEFARNYAATTIFHSNDVANAMNNMIHGGWNAVEVMERMVSVGHLAELGGMDLSNALTYVVDTTKALGIEGQEEITDFVDMWSYAANKSSGNARQFGDTMQKLGGVGTFAENKAELLSMIALMHNFGTKGTEAGTMIKTSMLRLIAPSLTSGRKLIQMGAEATLRSIAATEEEIEEVLEDPELIEMMNDLGEHGFHAFDESGNLRPMLDIYANLIDSLAQIAGGEEHILENEKTLSLMQNVFGMRGIVGITNITRGLEDAQALYDELMNGNAEGYGEWAAQDRMDTLYGSVETLESKWENLELAVGESLSGQTRAITENIGQILDKLAEFSNGEAFTAGLDMAERLTGWIAALAQEWEGLDDEQAAAIMGALGTMATIGPGLMAAGSGIQFVAWSLKGLGTWGGKLALVAMIAATVSEALNAMQKVDMEKQFGDMGLDETTLNQYVLTLGNDFDTAYKQVSDFQKALDDSVKTYENASQTFSGKLLTDLVTNKPWTEKDLQSYQTLGADMVAQVLKGAQVSTSLAQQYWQTFLKGQDPNTLGLQGFEGLEGFELYHSVIRVLEADYGDTVSQLEEIGRGLTGAINKAFEEGLTQENVDNIRSYFDELNEVVVRQQMAARSEAEEIAMRVQFRKMQSMDYSEMMDFLEDTVLPQRDQRLDASLENYWTNHYYALSAYDRQIAKAETEAEKEKLRAEKEALEKTADQGLATEQAKIYATYDRNILDLMNNTIIYSDLNGADLTAKGILDMVDAGLPWGQAKNAVQNSMSMDEWRYLGQFYRREVEAMGGEDAIFARIQQYTEAGDKAMVDTLLAIISMNDLLSGAWETPVTAAARESLAGKSDVMTADQAAALMWDSDEMFNQEGFRRLIDSMGDEDASMQQINSLFEALGQQTASLLETLSDNLKQTYDYDKIMADYGPENLPDAWKDYYALYLLTNGAINPNLYEKGDVLAGLEITGAAEATAAAIQEAQVYADIHPIMLGVSVSEDGSGGASGASYAAFGPDGAQLLQMFKPRAKGGRGTEPSIFAEAGIPEWFIPEEHTGNTLGLILGAAYGSGFDIYDLAAAAGARFFAQGGTTDGSLPVLSWGAMPSGGGSGGSEGRGGESSGIQVQYSPVIHADNAAGVSKALREDKKRFEKWMNEWWERKTLYESLVTYQ